MNNSIYFASKDKIFLFTQTVFLGIIVFLLNYIFGSFSVISGYISMGDVLFIILCLVFSVKITIPIAIFSYGLSDLLLGTPQYIAFSIFIRILYIVLFFIYKKWKFKNYFYFFAFLLFTQFLMIIIYLQADLLFYFTHFYVFSSVLLDIYYNIFQGLSTTILSFIIIKYFLFDISHLYIYKNNIIIKK